MNLEPIKIADGVYQFQREQVKVTLLLTPALYNALEPEAIARLENALKLPGLESVHNPP